MKKKYMLIPVLCLVILLTFIFIKSWQADKDKIMEVSKIQEGDLLLASIVNSKVEREIHKLKFKSKMYIKGKLVAIDENANVHTIAEVENGYINDYWINENRLYILYCSGKEVYDNISDTMKCVSYSLTEENDNEIINLDDQRIWGVDRINGELIIDKRNIEFESGLASNIYCDKEKRLYVDGNKLIEHDKNSDNQKSVQGSKNVMKYLFEDTKKTLGSVMVVEVDPIKLADKIILDIKQKRKDLNWNI